MTQSIGIIGSSRLTKRQQRQALDLLHDWRQNDWPLIITLDHAIQLCAMHNVPPMKSWLIQDARTPVALSRVAVHITKKSTCRHIAMTTSES